MHAPTGNRPRSHTAPRRAVALLVVIFVMSLTTVLVVNMVDTQMLEMAALRHTQEYERALYLAGAGAHHALAVLEFSEERYEDFTIGPIEFPAGSGNTYQAAAVEIGNTIVITGTGTSGDITRRVEVTVEQN